ncbi:MAG: SPOR domain-containing protein [Ignavibacteria bacterium]
MKIHYYLIVFIVIVTFHCSRNVKEENGNLTKEQVDLDKVNPLALFYVNEDSLKLFESFLSYPEKKVENKIYQKKIENNPQMNYFVQVGLTDSYEEINQLKNQLMSLFPNETIFIKYDSPFYRVLIGPYDSKSKANEIFSILERKNFSSIRIRNEISK